MTWEDAFNLLIHREMQLETDQILIKAVLKGEASPPDSVIFLPDRDRSETP